jgi:hypothetical protein
MRWMTLAHLHLDRVASGWLIRSFIDPGAEITYLDWDAERPADDGELHLFGMPGIALSNHDDDGTCFSKLLRAHEIDDPALALLADAVDAGVRHALGLEPVAGRDPDVESIGLTLDLIGVGFGVTSDDAEHLARASPMYDALYRLFQARTLPEEVQKQVPRLPGDRTAFLRDAFDIAR